MLKILALRYQRRRAVPGADFHAAFTGRQGSGAGSERSEAACVAKRLMTVPLSQKQNVEIGWRGDSKAVGRRSRVGIFHRCQGQEVRNSAPKLKCDSLRLQQWEASVIAALSWEVHLKWTAGECCVAPVLLPDDICLQFTDRDTRPPANILALMLFPVLEQWQKRL